MPLQRGSIYVLRANVGSVTASVDLLDGQKLSLTSLLEPQRSRFKVADGSTASSRRRAFGTAAVNFELKLEDFSKVFGQPPKSD